MPETNHRSLDVQPTFDTPQPTSAELLLARAARDIAVLRRALKLVAVSNDAVAMRKLAHAALDAGKRKTDDAGN